MSLQIRFDHRLDGLADALIDALSSPPAHPLAEDTVIVPSLGVGRWLQQRFASRRDVCAQVRIEFAGRYLWRTFRRLFPDLPPVSPFDEQVARWAIVRLLETLPSAEALAPLARRMAQATVSERLALATAIGSQFGRYLAWRRDWLVRWQQGLWAEGHAPLGPHEAWQRWLWCRLLEKLPHVSRTHPYDRFEALLRTEPGRVRAALGGERLAVFATQELSPEQHGLIAALSDAMDVSIYAPDPCRALWSDLVDLKALERIRASRPDAAWLYENEPSVLGNWGRASRDFVAQVATLEERMGVQAQAPFRDAPHPLDALVEADTAGLPAVLERLPRDQSRLGALQAAVFLRSDRPWRLLAGGPAADDSLQIHATHGLMRQAEVLHDGLLDCFERMPGLRPGDVAVFCVSIDEAADAIEAVFGSAPAGRRIPIAVSGRSARIDPLVRAALELLQLAERDLPLAQFGEWLANPAVQQALRLDEEAVGDLTGAFEAAGARWGLDAASGLPKHHWQAALDRLLLGAAMAEGTRLVGDTVPVPGLRRAGPESVERLIEVLDALSLLRQRGRAGLPVPAWCGLARRVLQGLFGRERAQTESLAQLLEALTALQEDASIEPEAMLDAAAFRRALSEQLDHGVGAALPSGAVTVAPLGGLRGVPYRVVCLFGMDENAFPRRSTFSEFDLMARAPRFGDRVARLDDRGVFLDAVLAARDRLVVLYQGRDARDDTGRNPSTLVTELIEYVNRQTPEDRPPFAVRVHRLHPFAPRNFDPAAGQARACSFAEQWLDTARQLTVPLTGRQAEVGPLVEAEPWEAETADGGAGRVEGGAAPAGATALEALRSALADPARAYLQDTLGLRLPGAHARIDEIEPLSADDARDRGLVEDAARRLLQGEDDAVVLESLVASPDTPAGEVGRVHARALLDEARALAVRALPPPSEAGPRQSLVSAYPLGMYALIDAWLRHLLWVRSLASEAVSGDETAAMTRLATPDAVVTVGTTDARAGLEHAWRWAQRIRSRPLPLLPRTYRAYRDTGDLERARLALRGDEARGLAGEVDRPWCAALYRDAAPDLETVIAAGEAAYGPILAACGIESLKR